MEKFSHLFEKINLFIKLAEMTASDARHLLGVSEQASKAEINKVYRHKARTMHPDVNPSPTAHDKMVELNNARDILLSPENQKEEAPEVQVNYTMKKRLEDGEAIDVRSIGREMKPGLYKLYEPLFDASKESDYCDADKQLWIFSIGRDKMTREVFASTDTRFYQNPKFDCLWLR